MLIRPPKWAFAEGVLGDETSVTMRDGVQCPPFPWSSQGSLLSACIRFTDFFTDLKEITFEMMRQSHIQTAALNPQIFDILKRNDRRPSQLLGGQSQIRHQINATINFSLHVYFAILVRDSVLLSDTNILHKVEACLKPCNTITMAQTLQNVRHIEYRQWGSIDRFYEVMKLMDVAMMLQWDTWCIAYDNLHQTLHGNILCSSHSQLYESSLLIELLDMRQLQKR
jgi:hypothetical protein